MTKEELIDFVEFSKEHWTFVTESGKRFSGEQVIEALKREPCEDAISRQKMLKYFEGWKNQIKYYHPYAKNFDIPYEEAVQWVKELPPVNPQKPKTDWIPVSERLPEKGRYLTTIFNEYDNSLRYIMTCDYILGDWCPDDECASDNVVAWMPLPELYDPQEEGSEE